MQSLTTNTFSFGRLFGHCDALEACKESELTRKNSSTDEEEHSHFQFLSPDFIREVLIVPKTQRVSTLSMYNREEQQGRDTVETHSETFRVVKSKKKR